jgi:hydroxymethylpyrimidine pyrophosphatase-like HAD family hydrolase
VLPLARLSCDEARGLDGLVLDLDDTVLDHGALGLEAYAALVRASEAGLAIVLATGRPSGWGEVLTRLWPVRGATTENGAIAFRREGRGVVRVDSVTTAERARRREGVASILAQVRARFPEIELADDVSLRVSDVTIDVGERCSVSKDCAAEIATLARSLGARVTVSSVHLHLSLDGDDKASGTLRFLTSELGVDPTRARARFGFVGDSGNDAACFAAFRTTFGVANVAPYTRTLSVPPRYVASRERGAGFAEVVSTLLDRRS